jgi:hypothetical protein
VRQARNEFRDLKDTSKINVSSVIQIEKPATSRWDRFVSGLLDHHTSVQRQCEELSMRAINFIIAASGISTIFIGMVLVSALVTSALHSTFYPRTPPPALTSVQN